MIVTVEIDRDTLLLFVGWVQAKREPGGDWTPGFVEQTVDHFTDAVMGTRSARRHAEDDS